MKKILLLAQTLLCSAIILASDTEYVNDKYCVYEINVGNQTAKVVNFYSTSPSVTIPESFVYHGDRYTVTSIGNKDFRYNYDSKYCYEDYKKNRACIVELTLPSTLQAIEGNWWYEGAFKGMTRLKTLTIPAGVKIFNAKWFGDNSRLESITFKGLPCYEYIEHDSRGEYPTRRIYLAESDNPSAIVDSMRVELQEYPCPKLQKIEVLPLKEYLPYANKLKDTISVYEQKLKQHPYYIESEEGYFKNIKMSPASNNFKTAYNNALKLCREKYSALMSEMENICKMKDPELYAEKYCNIHSDFSEQIDIMLSDYKCKYTKKQLAKLVLLKYNLGEKCQDELWRNYNTLYKSKEDFLAAYNSNDNINQILKSRQNTLNSFISYFPGQFDIQGIMNKSPKESYDIAKFHRKYKEIKQLEIPITKQVIAHFEKAQKEYLKNGQFFDTSEEFFDAYITNNYKQILKLKKKAIK